MKSKKLKPILKLVLIASFILTVSSCKVEIPDMEVCGDMGAHGAHCAHTEIALTRDVPLAAWQVERFGQVCMAGDSFGRLKAALEKICHASGDCKFEDLKKILDRIDGLKPDERGSPTLAPAPSSVEEDDDALVALKALKG